MPVIILYCLVLIKIFSFKKGQYRPIPFEDVLTILVSTFSLIRDERKGRESALLTWRQKRGREAFDPNGIGLLHVSISSFVLFNLVSLHLPSPSLKPRADCDAPCFEQLKATHLRASPKQQALLDVLLQLIKTWPLTIGPCYRRTTARTFVLDLLSWELIYSQYQFW